MIKDFFKNGKKYLDYLMGLDFTELFVNVIELFLLVLLACLVFLPIGLMQDLLYEIIRSALGTSEILFKWYNILFRFCTGVVALFVFIYLFNKRYSKLDKLIEKDVMRNRKAKQNASENAEKMQNQKVEMDLPKKKD